MGLLSTVTRYGFGPETLLCVCASVFIIVCVLPLHEFAHGYTAFLLGDKTAKRNGRLSLNPMAHIDPIGALMIILVGFGYAKSVPVNIMNFPRSKRKQYMAITALAGPLSNIVMALLILFCQCIFTETSLSQLEISFYISLFLEYAATINIGLAVFNLIPIPPLDGSRIMSAVLPDKYYYKIMQYERYIILIVFALIFIGVLDIPLSIISNLIYSLLWKIASFPFGLF